MTDVWARFINHIEFSSKEKIKMKNWIFCFSFKGLIFSFPSLCTHDSCFLPKICWQYSSFVALGIKTTWMFFSFTFLKAHVSVSVVCAMCSSLLVTIKSPECAR